MSLIGLNDKGWRKLQSWGFTSRQIQTISVFLNAKDLQEVADTMFISIKTVKHHFTLIHAKLGFNGVGRLWQLLVKEQMIDILQSDTQQEVVKSQPVRYQEAVKSQPVVELQTDEQQDIVKLPYLSSVKEAF